MGKKLLKSIVWKLSEPLANSTVEFEDTELSMNREMREYLYNKAIWGIAKTFTIHFHKDVPAELMTSDLPPTLQQLLNVTEQWFSQAPSVDEIMKDRAISLDKAHQLLAGPIRRSDLECYRHLWLDYFKLKVKKDGTVHLYLKTY